MAQEERIESTKRRLFEDLSVTQLIAGALAAATSLLLATRIGIAGSVIGVAVGSVVSAVAGAMYKQFLQASADKLKEVATLTALVPGGTNAGISERDDGAEKGFAGKDVDCVGGGAADESAIDGVASYEADVRQETLALLREEQVRNRRMQRRLIGVSIASALVAVVVTAVLVSVLTAGEGLGSKEPVFVPVAQHQPASGTGDASGEVSDQGDATSQKEEEASESGDKKDSEVEKDEGAQGSGEGSGQDVGTGSASAAGSGATGGASGSGSGSSDQGSGAAGGSGSAESGSGEGGHTGGIGAGSGTSGSGSASTGLSGGMSSANSASGSESAVGAGYGNAAKVVTAKFF